MILLAEDDEALGTQIVKTLTDAGYEVEWFRDGDKARDADLTNVRLVVLDLMLPGTYGLDILKAYRRRSDVPALILSARSDTSDKVRALKLGADDYLTKPFWPEELLARVAARLRRPQFERETNELVVGAISLDEDARRVSVSGEEIDLTSAEFEILLALMRRPSSAMTRAALVDAALDPGHEGGQRTLDVHISRLRKKLGSASAQLKTVWGIGYKIETAGTDA